MPTKDQKTDLYQVVTNRFIKAIKDAIDEGKRTGNWRKPWQTPAMTQGPANLISKKSYRGVNRIMLSLSPFESRFWLSAKQVADRKGTILPGEKPWQVVFWQVIKNPRYDPSDPNSPKAFPILKAYEVYNLDQTKDVRVPKWALPTDEPTEDEGPSPIDACEALVAAYKDREGITLKHGQAGAYYAPLLDVIGMPDMKHFHSAEGYYSTIFHEMGHSTGHKDRLNRPELVRSAGFGTETYSKEELTAEFTSALVAAVMGIDSESQEGNTEAYLRGWLKKLRDDKKLLVSAAGKAQKAADFILTAQEA